MVHLHAVKSVRTFPCSNTVLDWVDMVRGVMVLLVNVNPVREWDGKLFVDSFDCVHHLD